MSSQTNRAGTYVRQTGDYSAFVPSRLPPNPGISFDQHPELQELLSKADRALARVDAATEFLPNPDLFVTMYVRKEAVLSSQIEGTQASMVDLLDHEARTLRSEKSDVAEIVNYVSAMRTGLDRLEKLPLSLRLLKEIHAELLQGVRGQERNPGEFRHSQNWIGPKNCPISDATFVPPPPHEVLRCMGELELFLHEQTPIPDLVRIGLAHVQFETIHPFLDGNGRLGRLLITFFLCWKGILQRPMLYLSHYLKKHRTEYYDRLQAVRDDGAFEQWLKFFLKGVYEVSQESTTTARRIQELREKHRALVQRETNTTSGLLFLDQLFRRPVTTVGQTQELIGKSYPVANQLVADFERLGILVEVTGFQRNRVYRYQPYLDVFDA